MIRGTPSGVASAPILVGGRTGGGLSGNDSVAAAVMSDVLPTCESPTTHTLTGFAGFMSILQRSRVLHGSADLFSAIVDCKPLLCWGCRRCLFWLGVSRDRKLLWTLPYRHAYPPFFFLVGMKFLKLDLKIIFSSRPYAVVQGPQDAQYAMACLLYSYRKAFSNRGTPGVGQI